ncbi:hypothetical protein MTR67_007553 [Solanum verrucosum]|uniref:3-hydroxyisobutyrate dehydrogenase-like NAD-binding domain-containing protein n=1 Tax=Solanum verrucosum TaxID=315347 RepID=A0AAF0TF65_SOLVR|nr:hypothetical protein MTR67_007553 [Solanum verrucosum]
MLILLTGDSLLSDGISMVLLPPQLASSLLEPSSCISPLRAHTYDSDCISDTYNPVPGVMDGVPSSRNYIGGFASKLMAKDLNLAAASAKDIGFKCPLTSQAEKIFTELCNNGHEAKDFSGVFRYYYSGKDEQ